MVKKIRLDNQGNPFDISLDRLPKYFLCEDLSELLNEMTNCLENSDINEGNYLDYILLFEERVDIWIESHKY